LPHYLTMRTASYSALLLLCLPGGCSKQPLANEPSPLKVEMRRFERVVPGCGDEERLVQPCFSFQVAYPEVTAAVAPEAVARINGHIRAMLQPAGAPAGFEDESAGLIEQYQNRPLGRGSGDDEPAWFVRRNAEVVHSTAASLAIRVERTEYLGGPGASTTYDCVNLNPFNGARYLLQDLLVPGGEEKLRTIAQARFRADRKIPAGTLPPEVGYTVVESQFALPPRFLVEKRGLEFVFNPNEISQERGEPAQLIVPWGDISSLIRRETGVVPVP